MAKSSEVTALDAGLVSKSNYRGNVQAIAVTVASTGAGAQTVSGVLPDGARVVLADLTTASGTVKLGYSGDDDAVTADANTTFYGSVAVGGKTLLATNSATSAINGLILIVTDE